jgi:hypothetical protein
MNASQWTSLVVSVIALTILGCHCLVLLYNLVLWNRGPASAKDISLRARSPSGDELRLLDLAEVEFPLSRLDAGARYPIPWLLSEHQSGRLFICDLSWIDGSGPRSSSTLLRRGETRQ